MRRGKSLDTAGLRALGRLLPALALICALTLSWRAEAGETRSLTIYNIHTKETVTVTYKKDGKYDPAGMKQINHIMRDWRRDESTEMDPELIDLIWQLHKELGSKEPVHLISGYRSRKTNERLRRAGGGQARHSRHILGKAADIHFPDVPVKALRNSALIHEMGGVGYYPTSAIPFVHVDTGEVRHWPRLPRQELAALFPSGKTAHIPRDGRPIALADARAATTLNKRRAPTPPRQPETVVADASDLQSAEADFRSAKAEPIASQRRRAKEFLDLTAKAKQAPHFITAGLGSLSLPWLATMSGITGAIPEEKDAPAPAAKIVLAPANADEAIPAPPERPQIVQAVVAAAPEYDPEHPEELNYQPFPTLPLLTDSALAEDGEAVALEPPAHGETDYLLTTPYRRLELPLAPLTGVTKLALAREFTGPAVRSLLQPRQSEKTILTASSTTDTPAPLPAASPAPAAPAGPAVFGFGAIPR